MISKDQIREKLTLGPSTAPKSKSPVRLLEMQKDVKNISCLGGFRLLAILSLAPSASDPDVLLERGNVGDVDSSSSKRLIPLSRMSGVLAT